MARSREFKEAMRQRIRKLAADRDLSDEEPVLRLKHQEIGAFAIKHSVSLAWLLEGALTRLQEILIAGARLLARERPVKRPASIGQKAKPPRLAATPQAAITTRGAGSSPRLSLWDVQHLFEAVSDALGALNVRS
jgi:hypothetical protein